MSKPTRKDIAQALLDRYGTTFAEDVGIRLGNTPSPLFRMLCAAVLFSARIGADIAVQAARALAEKGWTTPEKMAGSTWSRRAQTLNRAGYARYDEKTSTMLGMDAEMLLERYKGDLRNLREAAGRDPEAERRLLKEFKGIGDTGADIFFREVQAVWEELYPFADAKALRSAEKLGLPTDPGNLSLLASKKDFPRLVDALVRADLKGEREEVLQRATS